MSTINVDTFKAVILIAQLLQAASGQGVQQQQAQPQYFAPPPPPLPFFPPTTPNYMPQMGGIPQYQAYPQQQQASYYPMPYTSTAQQYGMGQQYTGYNAYANPYQSNPYAYTGQPTSNLYGQAMGLSQSFDKSKLSALEFASNILYNSPFGIQGNPRALEVLQTGKFSI